MNAARDGVSRRFPPDPTSARESRRFLRSFLTGRGREDLADSVELALSEIVTNAVLHAHTDLEVTAELGPDGSLRVEVADDNPLLPVQRHYGEQATTGRGMQLVAALTDERGVSARASGGKAVWFLLRDHGGSGERRAEPGSWHAAPDVPAPRDDRTEVVLLRLPPTLWLAARQHHDAILRELALYAQEHPEDAPGRELLAHADSARGLVSSRVVAEVEAHRHRGTAPRPALPGAHASVLPDTPPALDLTLSVSPEAAQGYAELQDVLDVAERLSVAGLLLARPGLPEVVAVRDWVCEQVIAQLAGVSPSPWPGTGQDRFTVEVHDREAAAAPDWDTRIVAEADRGAVAADDANRIIAVSRPLAAMIGWDVDQLVGRRVVTLIPPELREAHVAGFTRHLTTGETQIVGVPLRLPVLCADGRRVDCHVLIEQTPATTGRPVYIAWIEPVA